MHNQVISQGYEKPSVVDYGSLQELTAACAQGGGGDAYTQGGQTFGVSNPVYECTSN